MEYPLETIMAMLRQVMWPLARISAMFMVMVTIGGNTVSRQIRLLLSVAVTAAVVPVLPVAPVIELFSLQGMLITLQQVLIGSAIGFVSVLVLNTFVLGGQIIGMQTSLGFASMIDPSNGQQVPLVGQFYLLLCTLLFFAFDGHLLMIKMTVASFTSLPIGQTLEVQSLHTVVEFGGLMFANALVLSLAATTALLLINFAFGVMTRAAPQLNIFAIGFPITMISGLLILWLTLGGVLEHFESVWLAGQDLICTLTQCEAP